MNWSIYDKAFASMEAEISTIYADHLMSDFLATEADGGSPKEGVIARIKRWWHNFCQMLKTMRDNFVAAAKKKWEAIKKLFGVMDRAPGTVEMPTAQADVAEQVGKAATQFETVADRMNAALDNIDKFISEIESGQPISSERTTEILSVLDRMIDDLNKSGDTLDVSILERAQTTMSNYSDAREREKQQMFGELKEGIRRRLHNGATDSFTNMQDHVDNAMEASSAPGKRRINLAAIRSKLKSLGQKANKGNERTNRLLQLVERFANRKASEGGTGDATANANEQRLATKIMSGLRVIGGFFQRAASAVAGAWHKVFPKREKTIVVPNTDVPDLSAREANRAMSLAMTDGTNPFMFG